jgi:hypothetical protein
MESTQSAGEIAARVRRLWKTPSAADAYVIVDAAQDYSPVVLLRDPLGKSPQSLFEGEAAAALAEVAPYVCPVELSGEFLDIWGERWGGNHGVLLASTADLQSLQKHLRSIFVVEDETGQEFFFRYYDPRVLRAYLPTCTAEEVREFFGPITSWCIEGEDPAVALVLEAGSEGVVQTEIPLA